MEIFILIISFIILMLVSSDAIFNGLELGKKSSWLYGLISLLCGLAIGMILSGHLDAGLIAGVIFAFITLSGGAVMRYHHRRFDPQSAKIKDNRFKTLYLRYKREKHPTFFTRLVQKILEKLIERVF